MHADHTAELKRLNRIAGQVEGVKRMISERRYCPDILAQTRAIQSALKSLDAEILRRHIAHCVHAAAASGDEAELQTKLDEIVAVFKRV